MIENVIRAINHTRELPNIYSFPAKVSETVSMLKCLRAINHGENVMDGSRPYQQFGQIIRT